MGGKLSGTLFSWLYVCLAISSANPFLSGSCIFIFALIDQFFSRCILVYISLIVSILRGISHLLKEVRSNVSMVSIYHYRHAFRSIKCFTIIKDSSEMFSRVLFVLCRFPCIWEGNLPVWERRGQYLSETHWAWCGHLHGPDRRNLRTRERAGATHGAAS